LKNKSRPARGDFCEASAIWVDRFAKDSRRQLILQAFSRARPTQEVR
jgi:hypothetical protein